MFSGRTRRTVCALVTFLFFTGQVVADELVTGTKRYARFERGEQVLFTNDFHQCPVGEMPTVFDDLSGVVECVKYQEHIWVAPAGKGTVRLVKKIALGKDDFSIDFHVVPKKYHDVKLFFDLYDSDPLRSGNRPVKTLEFSFEPMGCKLSLKGYGLLRKLSHCRDRKLHVAVQARRHQLRVFLDGQRVAATPFSPARPIAGFAFKRWGLDPKPYDVLLSDLVVAKYRHKEARPTPEKLGIQVSRSEQGLRLTIPEKVLFDFNQFILKPKAREALGVIGEIIRRQPVKRIIVTGYTDNVGSDAYNLRLSLQRAQSVADYLMYCENIDPKKFRILGKGKANPVADNRTEAGRAKNRRVEIRLLK